MAKAYSDDLRRKLLAAHDRGEGSLRALAQRFGVSVPWAWKISRQRRRSGQMERVEQRHGPPSRITAALQASLRGLVRQQPDGTLVELQQRLWASERVPVSFQHLWRVLQNMGLRLKKSRSTPKSKTRSRSKPVVKRGGAAVSQIDPQRLVFQDESGATTEMTRRYGRAPRGERVAEGTPAGHWRTLTLLGALSTRGVVAAMTVESPTDGDVFLAYVEQVLGPRLQPGQVVVMDNLPAHKKWKECGA